MNAAEAAVLLQREAANQSRLARNLGQLAWDVFGETDLVGERDEQRRAAALYAAARMAHALAVFGEQLSTIDASLGDSTADAFGDVAYEARKPSRWGPGIPWGNR